jgi:hypothetical protein
MSLPTGEASSSSAAPQVSTPLIDQLLYEQRKRELAELLGFAQESACHSQAWLDDLRQQLAVLEGESGDPSATGAPQVLPEPPHRDRSPSAAPSEAPTTGSRNTRGQRGQGKRRRASSAPPACAAKSRVAAPARDRSEVPSPTEVPHNPIRVALAQSARDYQGGHQVARTAGDLQPTALAVQLPADPFQVFKGAVEEYLAGAEDALRSIPPPTLSDIFLHFSSALEEARSRQSHLLIQEQLTKLLDSATQRATPADQGEVLQRAIAGLAERLAQAVPLTHRVNPAGLQVPRPSKSASSRDWPAPVQAPPSSQAPPEPDRAPPDYQAPSEAPSTKWREEAWADTASHQHQAEAEATEWREESWEDPTSRQPQPAAQATEWREESWEDPAGTQQPPAAEAAEGGKGQWEEPEDENWGNWRPDTSDQQQLPSPPEPQGAPQQGSRSQ